MSKALYINDKRVIIDSENTYFPFSYKVNDLEDVSLINLPTSKIVEIPRCPANDEIFGYIGELTRMSVGYDDNLIGISFNQTKKATYELYNDSELVSAGLITVVDINEINYNVTLSDTVIDKLESLSEVYLRDIQLLNKQNNTVSYSSNPTKVLELSNDINSGIVPTFNIKEPKLPTDSIYCVDYGNDSIFQKLDIDCTPLQIKSFKDYETNYAVLLPNIFNSLESSNNVKITPDALSIIDDLYLLGNDLKNDEVVTDQILTPGTMLRHDSTYSQVIVRPIVDGTLLTSKNGNYYIEANIICDCTATTTDGITYSKQILDDGTEILHTVDNTNDGDIIGHLWADVSLVVASTESTIYKPISTYTRIDLYKNVNIFFDFTNKKATIKTSIIVNEDFYPTTYIDSYPIAYIVGTNYVALDIGIYRTDPYYGLSRTNLFNNDMAAAPVGNTTLTSSRLRYKKLDFKTGDIISAKSILPKVSVKDFILLLCKYFDFDIKSVDNILTIDTKKYKLSNDVIIVDGVPDIDVNLISYSKLILSTNLPESDLLTEYETVNKKIYAEQVVNTGYSIKSVVKDIKFDLSTPLLQTDTNTFAYDRFTKYFNGGYNKYSTGNITGLADKITFGYIKKNNDFIYVSNDIIQEIKNTVGTINKEDKYGMVNELLRYQPVNHINDPSSDFKFVEVTEYTSTNTKKLEYYYTFSPYKFDNNNNIVKSIELNKPLYNFANISDDKYNESTTLYQRILRKKLSDKLSVNTHILKATIYIDGKIDIYKIFNYKNSYYIINNIPEYDPTQPGMYEIELIRVNDINNYLQPYGSSYPEVVINTAYYYDSSISVNSSLLETSVGLILESGVVWNTTGNPTISNNKIINYGSVDSWTSNITGLSVGQTCYIKAYATNDIGVGYSDERVIYITPTSAPTVETTAATNVLFTTAILNGKVTYPGTSPITSRGFLYNLAVYGEPSTSNINSSTIEIPGGTGTMLEELYGLTEAVSYNFRAYAVNSVGRSYGNTLSFTMMEIIKPSVVTNSIDNVAISSFRVNSNVTSAGYGTLTARGVVYSTSNYYPTLADSVKIATTTTTGAYSLTLDGLSNNTYYIVRSYATNEKGTTYSNGKTVTTGAVVVPTLTTGAIESISYTTATGRGTLNNNGGGTVTERGFVVGTNTSPDITNSTKIVYNGSSDIFVSTLTPLNPNVKYYYRAYATNSAGTGYGNIVSFNTLGNIPSVTTLDVIYFNETSATMGGLVTSDGGSPITARSIQIESGAYIQTYDIADGLDFSQSVYNLSPNTTYTFIVTAENAFGVAQGEVKSFTTSAAAIDNRPMLSPGGGLEQGQYHLYVESELLSVGGSPITEMGHYWAVAPLDPYLSGNKVIYTPNLTAPGWFDGLIEGLQPNTEYKIAGYAINSFGQGLSLVFTTTTAPGTPTINMIRCRRELNGPTTTGLCDATVTEIGGSVVTAAGFCYSKTEPNPTKENSDWVSATTINNLPDFSGRIPYMTGSYGSYYITAFAVNESGTGYSNVIRDTEWYSLLV